jgi:hypothetical protein
MPGFPRIGEWRSGEGASTRVLSVDQFGHVTLAEIVPTPFSGGCIRVSYSEFLMGRCHAEIHDIFGDEILGEALTLVGQNASLASGEFAGSQ